MMAVLCPIFGNVFMFVFICEWTMSHHVRFLQCHSHCPSMEPSGDAICFLFTSGVCAQLWRAFGHL